MSTRALVLALASLSIGTAMAAAQTTEPARLDGVWVGTWWMGKYEEPIEMELAQRGDAVSGRVAMLGYPSLEGYPSENAPLQDGRLDGDRLVLTWRIGGRPFTATLAVTGPGTLFGLGSEDGRVTTGLGLSRQR